MKVPCIVITRDRLSYAERCVASLERFSVLDIHIVDHGSTYGPMMDYLRTSPHPCHLRGDDTARGLWGWSKFPEIVGQESCYLVTDCDIVLDPDCPNDWLGTMFDHLDDRGNVDKVGLGLRIDDLPATRLGTAARQWELSFWQRKVSAQAYAAPVDTTLALYRPLSERPSFSLAPAVRLAEPYLIRHLPWYGDLDVAEAAYYREHCLPGASHWVNGGWHHATVTS